jgi:hypothetical protein
MIVVTFSGMASKINYHHERLRAHWRLRRGPVGAKADLAAKTGARQPRRRPTAKTGATAAAAANRHAGRDIRAGLRPGPAKTSKLVGY